MRENNRNSIEKCREKLPQFTTMNVIDGQAGLMCYSSLIFYSLTIDNILNIIVLLILAGITIATLTGDNGIINQANNATIKTDNGTVAESLKLKLQEYKIGKATGEIDQAQEDITLLEEDGIINTEGVVNVEELVGEKLKTGNGSDGKDVYVIKDEHLYYYDKDGNEIDLGELTGIGEKLEETNPDLFEIDEEGRITLKDFASYYNNEREWTIENVVIPGEIDGQEVKIIGRDLFRGFGYGVNNFRSNANIISIVIPEGVVEIEPGAFDFCTKLKEITLSSTVEDFDRFDSCNSLENVYVNKNNPIYADENGIVYNKNKSILSFCPKGKSSENLVIPTSVTNIIFEAFKGCENLKNIVLPDTVTTMGGSVFSGWTPSQTIQVPFKEGELPEGWDEYWNLYCEANIIYQQ